MRRLKNTTTIMNKKKVMLHYFQHGSQRSPNDQFDILSKQNEICQKYELSILNQEYLPREIGTIKSIKLLKQQIDKVKPDVVHISGVKEGFHCMIAAVLSGCKNRILVTHGFAGYSSVNSPLKRWICRWIIEPITLMLATSVQCNSEFSYDLQMVRLFARNKRHVIYNFLKREPVEAPHWRKENGISDEDVVITTIGNMHLGKGYDIVTQMIAHFKGQEHVKFAVIGDGSYRKTFEAENAEAIAEKRVFCMGAIPHQDAMQILSESDIFFLPTRYETLGMVFAEAGCLGIPSVGTDVGAVKELLQDQIAGFLVKKDCVSEMKDALQRLVSDAELRKNMGVSAGQYIFEVLSDAKTSEKIIRLYERK